MGMLFINKAGMALFDLRKYQSSNYANYESNRTVLEQVISIYHQLPLINANGNARNYKGQTVLDAIQKQQSENITCYFEQSC